MKQFNKIEVVDRIESCVYKLKYRRSEGFGDKTLVSDVLINEVKYLFSMLDKVTQTEILRKPWLDQ